MDVSQVPLSYDADARSVHTVLRIVDQSDHERTNEMLFDNLTTPMRIIALFQLQIRQEFMGFSSTDRLEGRGLDEELPAVSELAGEPVTGADLLRAAREFHSGPGDDALVIECYGDPAIIDQLTA